MFQNGYTVIISLAEGKTRAVNNLTNMVNVINFNVTCAMQVIWAQLGIYPNVQLNTVGILLLLANTI